MQGSAVALPPALFSAPPHLIFEEQFEFVPDYPEIPHHAPVCDLLLFSSNWRSFTYITYLSSGVSIQQSLMPVVQNVSIFEHSKSLT